MSRSTPVTLYVNVIGAVCAMGLGAYFIRSSFEDTSTPRCSSTYPAPTQITFENDAGQPLSPAELQARAGAQERGMLENARVVAADGAPSRSVLEVRVSGTPDEAGVRSGWQMASLRAARSACLAYSVWLPDGFQYGNLGLLPGLYAGRKLDPSERPVQGAGFATRVRWSSEGGGDVVVQAPSTPDGQGFSGDAFKLPTGRWVRVEQEVGLNNPGQADGILRVWIDGKLAVEAGGVVYRGDATMTLAGVAADVGYGDTRTAARDTAVRISPFDLSWR